MLALLLALAQAAGAGGFEIYEPEHRSAEELVSVATAVLGGQGTAVADTHSGKIVLTGEPEAISQALAALRSLDQPLRQYRVESETTTREALERASARVGGWIDTGGVRIGRVAGPEGVRVRARASDARGTERLGAQVVVLEGGEAEIWTGADVPVTTRSYERLGPYARALETTQLVPVRSGFRVRPRSAGGDAILVDVTPIRSELEPDGAIRTTGTATQVRVRPGESIVLGGIASEAQSSAVELPPGARRESGASETLVVLTVTPLDAGVPASRGR